MNDEIREVETLPSTAMDGAIVKWVSIGNGTGDDQKWKWNAEHCYWWPMEKMTDKSGEI